MPINSTRRKWFAPAYEPPAADPVEHPTQPPAPDPQPEVVRPDREMVTLLVGAATVGGRRPGAGTRPGRGNAGRWT